MSIYLKASNLWDTVVSAPPDPATAEWTRKNQRAVAESSRRSSPFYHLDYSSTERNSNNHHYLNYQLPLLSYPPPPIPTSQVTPITPPSPPPQPRIAPTQLPRNDFPLPKTTSQDQDTPIAPLQQALAVPISPSPELPLSKPKFPQTPPRKAAEIKSPTMSPLTPITGTPPTSPSNKRPRKKAKHR